MLLDCSVWQAPRGDSSCAWSWPHLGTLPSLPRLGTLVECLIQRIACHFLFCATLGLPFDSQLCFCTVSVCGGPPAPARPPPVTANLFCPHCGLLTSLAECIFRQKSPVKFPSTPPCLFPGWAAGGGGWPAGGRDTACGLTADVHGPPVEAPQSPNLGMVMHIVCAALPWEGQNLLESHADSWREGLKTSGTSHPSPVRSSPHSPCLASAPRMT